MFMFDEKGKDINNIINTAMHSGILSAHYTVSS